MNADLAAGFVADTGYDRLPDEVAAKAKRCLLDFLGVALSSSGLPAYQAGRELLEGFGDGGAATVIGSGERLPLLAAVWANTLLGSVMDLEDGYYPSVGHPGSVVFPVTLAFAEHGRASGREFLAASVIGYEICARAGQAMTRFYRKRALGSGGSSVYGAAAAASRLLGLDKRGVGLALGAAGVYMPSTPVHYSIDHQSMVKGGIPWGTFVGASSALLARGGFAAPPATMQDPFADPEDPTARPIFQTLGSEWEIRKVYFKRYPSCRWTHAPLDAVLEIVAEHKLAAGEIDSVRIETFEEAARLDHGGPVTLEGFQFDIPYTVAAALVYGDFTVEQMTAETLQDPRVSQLARKVSLVADPELSAMFPVRRPARVTISLADGGELSREVLNLHGEAGGDFETQGYLDKFIALASPRIGPEKCGQLIRTVEKLDRQESLDGLVSLLHE